MVMTTEATNTRRFTVFAIAAATICMLALGLVGCSSESQTSVSAGTPVTPIETEEAPASSVFDCDYFTVELPGSWADNWSATPVEENRPAMNASNHGYVFALDGEQMFTIWCKVFNLDSTAAIGQTSDQAQIEFVASDALSSADKDYVLNHIEFK